MATLPSPMTYLWQVELLAPQNAFKAELRTVSDGSVALVPLPVNMYAQSGPGVSVPTASTRAYHLAGLPEKGQWV